LVTVYVEFHITAMMRIATSALSGHKSLKGIKNQPSLQPKLKFDVAMFNAAGAAILLTVK
jgi:hypothetical protein